MTQTKIKKYAEDHVKTENFHCITDLSCCSEMNLSHCFKQYDWYFNQQDLFQQHQYDFNNINNFNDFADESASNISDVFQRCCDNNNIHFQSEEVDFFNLHLNTKNYESDDIVDIKEKIYFYDIHLFINFFKNIICIKTDDIIWWNLNKYLCDIAQNWYIGQLLTIECDYIHKKLNVKYWEEILFQCFKHIQFNVMKISKMKHYTIQNVCNNHEPFNFILNVIWHTKNINMIKISVQLT